jgi:hypothetical protein
MTISRCHAGAWFETPPKSSPEGGGALGAYQTGVFEGMVESGLPPDWVAGVSIGAINAALIAGNTPDRRSARGHRRVAIAACSMLPLSPDVVALESAQRRTIYM